MKTAIKNESVGKLEGWHTLSTCDIRHPKVKGLEKDLHHTIDKYRNAVNRAKKDYYTAKLNEQHAFAADLKLAIRDIKRRWHEEVTQIYRMMQELTLVNQITVKNILPTAGRTVVAQWLVGDNTTDADDGANYGSLGSGSTTPANGNTQLNTETYRKATSSGTNSANVAYLSNFYTATEVTGTFEEAGWHLSGTASANTGDLLSHFLTGTITKTSVETLTIESQITVS